MVVPQLQVEQVEQVEQVGSASDKSHCIPARKRMRCYGNVLIGRYPLFHSSSNQTSSMVVPLFPRGVNVYRV
jgi:hypothetical protein